MTFPEGGSVEVENLLGGGHGANRSKIKFQICSCDRYIADFCPPQWVNCVFPPRWVKECLGLINLINIAVTADPRPNSRSAAALTIRILIGFITYDKIHVIETAVNLLLYLNLCSYRGRCSSATQHTYLIELQRYYNRS